MNLEQLRIDIEDTDSGNYIFTDAEITHICNRLYCNHSWSVQVLLAIKAQRVG